MLHVCTIPQAQDRTPWFINVRIHQGWLPRTSNSKGCCNTHVNQHVADWKYPSISPTKVRNKNKTDMDQISNGRTVPFYRPVKKKPEYLEKALATVSGVRWELVPFNF